MSRPTSHAAGAVGLISSLIVAVTALAGCSEKSDDPLVRSFGTDDVAKICDLRPGSCASGVDGRGEKAAVIAAVHELQLSFLEGDVDRLCSAMTRAADRSAGSFAHGQPKDCAANVRHGFRTIEQGGGWRSLANPPITGVTVRGDRATARVTHPRRRWPADVELVRQGGRWKLAAPIGLPVSLVRRRVVAARSRRFPPPRGRPLMPLDRDGRPCPALGDGRVEQHTNLILQPVPDSCRIRVEEGRMDFELLTGFGDFSFAKRCEISDFQVVVGRGGRTYMDWMNLTGPDGTGCGDVYRCPERPRVGTSALGKLAPWKGRLTADGHGGFVHTMDACVGTCVGNFTGRLTMHLRRRGGRWWLEADHARVGTSGFEFDGRVPVANEQLRIRTTAD